MSITVKKSQAERYFLRETERFGWWAIITLDDDAGDISVQSDFGNYAYCWNKGGRGTETLKEFLTQARGDSSYIMDKFSYGREKWFNQEATIRELKKHVESIEGEPDLVTRAVEEIEEQLDDGDIRTTGEYYARVQSCEAIMEVYGGNGYDLPCVTGVTPDLRAFMEKVWPAFLDTLNGELDARRAGQPG